MSIEGPADWPGQHSGVSIQHPAVPADNRHLDSYLLATGRRAHPRLKTVRIRNVAGAALALFFIEPSIRSVKRPAWKFPPLTNSLSLERKKSR
jgi:hypothetical protein